MACNNDAETARDPLIVKEKFTGEQKIIYYFLCSLFLVMTCEKDFENVANIIC